MTKSHHFNASQAVAMKSRCHAALINFLAPLLMVSCFVFLPLSNLQAKQNKPTQVSKEKLTKIEKMHADIIKLTPIYDSAALTDYVNAVGQRLVTANGAKKRTYQFFVLDSPDINAFTPGFGLIYINRGLVSLLTSEAQLAGVLAHEIGHNIGRHIGRTKRRHVFGSVAAVTASVLTQDSNVGNSINLANQARLSGFGRELELEADEYAAQMLYQAKYDPNEMLSVLGVLKDHERFSASKAKQKGAAGAYHGVFSSHPRSDKRLQEVVKKAGTLPPGEGYRGRESMREALSGVVYGINYDGNKVEGRERYTHKGLGITFTYPEDWSRSNKGKSITLKDAIKSIQLKITIEKTQDKSLNSEQILNKKYPSGLQNITKIDAKATKDLGVIARYGEQRVAVIQVGRNTFYFQGIAKNNKLSEAQDELFVDIIRSFRRASLKDMPADTIKVIYYERLKPGQTFDELAQNEELGTYTQENLRLMNGYYPKGEAEPGTWIKLVKSGSVSAIEKEKP